MSTLHPVSPVPFGAASPIMLRKPTETFIQRFFRGAWMDILGIVELSDITWLRAL